MAGRNSLQGLALGAWADEGETWLRKHFGEKLDFHTSVDANKLTVTLKVYRKLAEPDKASPSNTGPGKLIFEVTEPVQSFVSQHTTTKIILIA